jgi:hypothetical protein
MCFVATGAGDGVGVGVGVVVGLTAAAGQHPASPRSKSDRFMAR